MKKSILASIVLLAFVSTTTVVLGADEKDIYRSILKIRTYEYNSTNNTYSISQEGSAVAIGSWLLLTNAHVVFNAKTGVPDGFYEICRTIDFRKKAVCFTTGEIVGYDEGNDLALMRFTEPSDLPIAPLFTEDVINIGAYVVAYGYPAIGWKNISRTQGNVAGYEEPFYKIDGAIDHGNSGGWAFNKFGQLLGIPSRVSSDNAVIGYMIPITTIREFLAKKSKGYLEVSLKVPADFKKFIREVEQGERSNDIINDSFIKTTSLKKHWLTFVGKVEWIGTFLYGMKLSNLNESSALVGCYRLGWELTQQDLDLREIGDTLKMFTVTDTYVWKDNRYLVRSLESRISLERWDVIGIYDTTNTCSSAISNINIKKDKKLVDQAISFLTTWITLKNTYKQTSWFATRLFSLTKFPQWVSLRESPRGGGDSALELGYFSRTSNTGETLSEIYQKEKDTVDWYFLGGKGYFDNSPSDTNLKPSDYSYETFRKIYEKKYSEDGYKNAKFTIEQTRNGKKYILGTADYKSEYYQNTPSSSVLIYSYPYMTVKWDKKEYYELTYLNSYEWGNTNAISGLKEFFAQIELVGSAPF